MFAFIATCKKEFNYSYNEIMYDIPYISLLLQISSISLSEKKQVSRKDNNENLDKTINLLDSI